MVRKVIKTLRQGWDNVLIMSEMSFKVFVIHCINMWIQETMMDLSNFRLLNLQREGKQLKRTFSQRSIKCRSSEKWFTKLKCLYMGMTALLLIAVLAFIWFMYNTIIDSEE